MIEPIHQGQLWLETLLKLMGFPVKVSLEIKEDTTEGSTSWLIIDETELTPLQVERLIGERGVTLDAIQYLANIHLNMGKDSESQKPIMVEVGNYRIKRQAELEELTWTAAQEVRETGQEVKIKSLSSAERRQVHSLLNTVEDLETESQGQEPERYIVVRLKSVASDLE